MKENRLIAINTLASYGQSLVALVTGLFSARWILEALGAVDLGLFGVVGSIILLITFLNTALALGVSRFYAYAIGHGKNISPQDARDDLMRWFNTALSLHLALGCIILLLGWPAGEYAIRNWLNIPADRLESCVTVFHYSLITAFFSILSVPFTAMYAAHQAIAQVALFRIAQNLLTLLLAWVLLSVDSNRLVFYAAGMTAISVAFSLILVTRAAILFKACRVRFSDFGNVDYLKKLFNYVGWKFLGTACVVLRNGGIPVMINLYFGPVMNAAFNIANRVSIQTSSLATSLQGAFQPAIVTAEGTGDRAKMIGMSLKVCRYGSLLVLLFILPLGMEMQAVIDIWLKLPPPHTAELCQWILGMLLLEKMTSGAMLAVNAYGKIALYEIIQGGTFLLALPIMWLLQKQGLGARSVGLAMFISTAVYCIGRLIFAKKLVDFPIIVWFKQVGVPVALIILAGGLLGLNIQQFYLAGWIRLAIITSTLAVLPAILGFFILLSTSERGHALLLVRELILRKRIQFSR